MTKGEFLDLTSHLDDDTEIIGISIYDFDGESADGAMSISDVEEIGFYHDEDKDRPVILLLMEEKGV